MQIVSLRMLLEARSDGEAGKVALQVRSWHEAATLYMVSLCVLLAILLLHAQRACSRCTAFAKSTCA